MLRFLNVTEVFLASTILLLSAAGSPSGMAAVREAFSMVAFQPEFNQGAIASSLIIAVNWISVLIIFTGGVAMLIGKMGETFSDSSR